MSDTQVIEQTPEMRARYDAATRVIDQERYRINDLWMVVALLTGAISVLVFTWYMLAQGVVVS